MNGFNNYSNYNEMKLYHRIILLFLILFFICFNRWGINWGIPSEERTELVFPVQLHNESFYLLMKQAREEIYKQSMGSPIGRLRDSSSLSPVLKSIGIIGNENLYFNGDKKILANFIRPYLLRSNHPDEQMTIASLAGMHPKQFDFNPRIFQYGGAYIYVMGAWLGMHHILGVIKLSSDLNFYFRNPGTMGKIFVAGRSINSVFCALTIFLIFIIAKITYSVRAAIFSSLFFIVCPAIVFQSHIMKPYPMATFFAFACLYYSVIMMSDSTKKNYILAGVFAGLTAGTMPVYAFIMLAPLTAHMSISKRLTKNLLFTVLAGTLIFFITNPYWLINYKDIFLEVKTSADIYNLKSGIVVSDFFLKRLLLSLPTGLLFISLAGLIHGIYLGKKQDILFILTSMIPLLIFGWIIKNQQLTIHNSRFLLPWLATLLILAAGFIDNLLDKKYVTIPVVVFTVFAVTQALLISSIYNKNFSIDGSVNSTRVAAGKWISDNIPFNSTIGTNYMPEPAHFPPFDFSKYRIVVLRNDIEKNLPGYFVTVNARYRDNINYQLIKSFKPIDSIGIFKFNAGMSGANSLVNIYKFKA